MRHPIHVGVILLTLAILCSACGRKDTSKSPAGSTPGGEAKITFLELGSVTCIPCKQMKPVMESIEKRYAGQVKVIFYDVWKDKRPAEQYKIRLIPTQVFLDKSGKELLRHEGFFAEAEIDKFLAAQGVKPKG
jgi:thioredoxin 1